MAVASDARGRSLFVKFRRLLELGIAREVVLNPKLSASFLQEGLDGGSGCDGLLDVEFRGRDPIQLPLLRIMIEIAAQQNWASFRQFQKQDLVVRRVPRGGLDHN